VFREKRGAPQHFLRHFEAARADFYWLRGLLVEAEV
jgi:hypothetical protein